MRTFVLVALAAAVAILGWLHWQRTREAPFVVSGFIEADEVRVGSRVGGRVAEVLVEEGSLVKAGAPLLRIDPFDLGEQLAQAQAELAAAQADHARLQAGFRPEEVQQARGKRDQVSARLAKLVAGPRPQEIEAARQHLAIAQAALALAESDYARLERLQADQQAAPREHDEATRGLKSAKAQVAAAEQDLALLVEGSRREDIDEAQAGLAEVEAALKLLEAGYRKEDVAQATARVAAAQARVSAIDTRVKDLTVFSPCDCTVEAIDLHPGDLVPQSAPTVALLDTTSMWVRAYVPEARLGEVQLGGEVPIKVDSFPGERFAGRVTFISRQAEFTPKNIQTPEERSKQVFRIKVKVVSGLDRLRVGMAADVLLGEASRS